MKDRFWKLAAAVGLVVAAVYVFGVCRPFAPVPVGAQSGEIIAVAPSNNSSYALYVIDTSKKVLLVYDASGGVSRLSSYSLIYGRTIDPDAVLVTRMGDGELKFNSRGYSGLQVRRSIAAPGRPGGR